MSSGRRIIASLAVAVAAGVGGSGLLALPASGAARVVQLASGVSVTVAPGWSVQTTTANTATIIHRKPAGAFSVLATGTVTATVSQALKIHITQFAQGAGLKHLRYSTPQPISTGAANFDQASQLTFSGTAGGLHLSGAAVEYQNSETGNGAFAAVIGPPSSKGPLKKSANAMFNSLLSAG